MIQPIPVPLKASDSDELLSWIMGWAAYSG